ncbi:hypothetical protein C8R47DRAFT_1225380 [Mycena vitilis]|nr:hypothetical protein C8R47DRAFT_1225380 [Mycena vitilis]
MYTRRRRRHREDEPRAPCPRLSTQHAASSTPALCGQRAAFWIQHRVAESFVRRLAIVKGGGARPPYAAVCHADGLVLPLSPRYPPSPLPATPIGEYAPPARRRRRISPAYTPPQRRGACRTDDRALPALRCSASVPRHVAARRFAVKCLPPAAAHCPLRTAHAPLPRPPKDAFHATPRRHRLDRGDAHRGCRAFPPPPTPTPDPRCRARPRTLSTRRPAPRRARIALLLPRASGPAARASVVDWIAVMRRMSRLPPTPHPRSALSRISRRFLALHRGGCEPPRAFSALGCGGSRGVRAGLGRERDVG